MKLENLPELKQRDLRKHKHRRITYLLPSFDVAEITINGTSKLAYICGVFENEGLRLLSTSSSFNKKETYHGYFEKNPWTNEQPLVEHIEHYRSLLHHLDKKQIQPKQVNISHYATEQRLLQKKEHKVIPLEIRHCARILCYGVGIIDNPWPKLVMSTHAEIRGRQRIVKSEPISHSPYTHQKGIKYLGFMYENIATQVLR